ncbi:hypothetical protein [Bradyrhizobium sp. LeoA1S1]
MAIGDVDVLDLCNSTKLRRAARHVNRFYDAHIAASGLRVTQYAILGHLKQRGPKSMLELDTGIQDFLQQADSFMNLHSIAAGVPATAYLLVTDIMPLKRAMGDPERANSADA